MAYRYTDRVLLGWPKPAAAAALYQLLQTERRNVEVLKGTIEMLKARNEHPEWKGSNDPFAEPEDDILDAEIVEDDNPGPTEPAPRQQPVTPHMRTKVRNMGHLTTNQETTP